MSLRACSMTQGACATCVLSLRSAHCKSTGSLIHVRFSCHDATRGTVQAMQRSTAAVPAVAGMFAARIWVDGVVCDLQQAASGDNLEQ